MCVFCLVEQPYKMGLSCAGLAEGHAGLVGVFGELLVNLSEDRTESRSRSISLCVCVCVSISSTCILFLLSS